MTYMWRGGATSLEEVPPFCVSHGLEGIDSRLGKHHQHVCNSSPIPAQFCSPGIGFMWFWDRIHFLCFKRLGLCIISGRGCFILLVVNKFIAHQLAGWLWRWGQGANSSIPAEWPEPSDFLSASFCFSLSLQFRICLNTTLLKVSSDSGWLVAIFLPPFWLSVFCMITFIDVLE